MKSVVTGCNLYNIATVRRENEIFFRQYSKEYYTRHLMVKG